jgi:hypothetical protein
MAAHFLIVRNILYLICYIKFSSLFLLQIINIHMVNWSVFIFCYRQNFNLYYIIYEVDIGI